MGEPSLAWSLSEAFDGVPYAVRGSAAERVAAWWEAPRRFACATARTSPLWFVIGTDPRAWCVRCAVRQVRAADRCQGCGEQTPLEVEVIESSGGIVFIEWHCQQCRTGGTP